jgi:predicted secreted hydrolase
MWLGVALMMTSCSQAPAKITAGIDLGQALSDETGSFATVVPGRPFLFPADHGEHPEYKTEWWYFTGNLREESGRAYGYQLTFFRSGLPSPEGPRSQSSWSPRDVMMAHFAISDPQEGQFYPFERFARRSLGLSGVKSDAQGVSVWLEDWRMDRGPDGTWVLVARDKMPDGTPLKLALRLSEQKPPVLQGQDGYSRKGPKPEHASYYVSLTRLTTEGEVTFGERAVPVKGLSWFDHEWSSAAMAPGLAGWDWFSLQFDDGWELMIYLLRYEDGRLEPASSGSLIAPDGSKTPLALKDFEVEVGDRHRSPRGIDYPSAWTVRIPSQNIVLRLTPRLADQEMASGVPYWEGAVVVEGERAGRAALGSGFVEMTGYK